MLIEEVHVGVVVEEVAEEFQVGVVVEELAEEFQVGVVVENWSYWWQRRQNIWIC